MLLKNTKPRKDLASWMLVREIEAAGAEMRTEELDRREQERVQAEAGSHEH